jgi:hypothetical protein
MPSCIYQCINGKRVFIAGSCIEPCPPGGMPCTEEGYLISTPCPDDHGDS